MAKTTIIIPIEILTGTTYALRKLQQVYPPCEIVNQFLTLFEILSAYGPQIDSKDRIDLSDSFENILSELINIKKTLEGYIEPGTDYISEEEREKVKEILNFDAELASTLLDELSKRKNK